MRFFFLLSFLSAVLAKDWAVIVAGSKSYGNYRHQADACHAYHVTSKFGIPDERIIMMFYDDIASYSKNPYPGKMFNKPTESGTAGVDVYKGCKKDYTGAQVTPANFVKVLTGDTSAPGPVLKSTSSDNVFINFVDHGGTGIIAFPSQTMSSSMLMNALKKMHSGNMYKKLVFYMEACESGSMFEGLLPTNMNIYATTASNAKESSWGTYCPPDDKVNGKSIGSCLGDLYSVNWMEDADKVGKEESLQTQFETVKKLTAKSHVMQYGDLSWTSDPIGDFMGDTSNNGSLTTTPRKPSVDVKSRDIPLHLAYYQYIRSDSEDFATRQMNAAALISEIQHRQEADSLFHKLAEQVSSVDKFFQEANFKGECLCCDEVHAAVAEKCGGYTDYSLQYSRVVVNLCEVSNAATIIEQLEALC
jgi:legumain